MRPVREDRGSGRKVFHAAAVPGICGTLLLVLLIVFCLPLTVPRLFGYHIYSVVSGSMEPAVPVGSLIYIREVPPEEVAEGDIIAFYGARDTASIITHRVVENRVVMGQFITRGDANPTEDLTPVPYGNLIGQAVRVIPAAGKAAELLAGPEGKILAGGMIAAAVLLQMVSSALRRKAGQ